MQLSKMFFFLLGIVVGAVFLGTPGGDAIREAASGLRTGGAAIMSAAGGGSQQVGDMFAEN